MVPGTEAQHTLSEQPEAAAAVKRALVIPAAYEANGGHYAGYVLIRNGHQTTRTSQEPVTGNGKLLAELRAVNLALEEAVEHGVTEVEVWTSLYPVIKMLPERQQKNGGYGKEIAAYHELAEELDSEPVFVCKKDPALFAFIRFILQGQAEMVSLMRQMKNGNEEQAN